MVWTFRRKYRRYIPPRWLFVLSVAFLVFLILRRKLNAATLDTALRFLNFASSREFNDAMSEHLAGAIYTRNEEGKLIDVKTSNGSYQTGTIADAETHVHQIGTNTKNRNPSIQGVSSLVGSVNVHIWKGLCCPKVNSLRQYPLFPHLAIERFLRHTINSGPMGTWYGQRIMGYVHPPLTGNYTFRLKAHAFAELWLSQKQNLKDAELIAKIAKVNWKLSLARVIGPTSKCVHLIAKRKYFFDVLHVMNGGMLREDHVNVTWKVPGSSTFIEVSSRFLSPLLGDNAALSLGSEESKERSDLLRQAPSVVDTEENDTDSGEDDEDYDGIEVRNKQDVLSETFASQFGNDFEPRHAYNGLDFERFPETDDDILAALPSCHYEPTYVTRHRLERYEGVWKTHYSWLFPDDGTGQFICIQNKLKEDCKGNDLLSENQVLEVVRMLIRAIDKKFSR